MSPSAALESSVFWIYLTVTCVLLLVGGLALSILHFLFKKNVAAVWLTYRGWLMMVPFIFVCVLGGRVTIIAAVTFVSLAGFKEFARATGLYRDWWLTNAVYLSILALGVLAWMPNPKKDELGWYGLYMAMPVYALALILTVPILLGRTKGQLQQVSLATIGFVYLGWMFCHLSLLTNTSHAYGYLFYLLFVVEMGDVAAYCCGKLWGRHKLNPEISPKKTWEGVFGAVAVALVMPWVMRFSFPHFDTFDLLLTGLLVAVGAQLGDLTISFVKRDIGVKDMGATIPGHGGILDRIDSLVVVAPIFYHVTRWFHG
jgi:phosphatidate cytidylyltransferase